MAYVEGCNAEGKRYSKVTNVVGFADTEVVMVVARLATPVRPLSEEHLKSLRPQESGSYKNRHGWRTFWY